MGAKLQIAMNPFSELGVESQNWGWHEVIILIGPKTQTCTLMVLSEDFGLKFFFTVTKKSYPDS